MFELCNDSLINLVRPEAPACLDTIVRSYHFKKFLFFCSFKRTQGYLLLGASGRLSEGVRLRSETSILFLAADKTLRGCQNADEILGHDNMHRTDQLLRSEFN